VRDLPSFTANLNLTTWKFLNMKVSHLAIALALALASVAPALAAPVTENITADVVFGFGAFGADAGSLTGTVTVDVSQAIAGSSLIGPGSTQLSSQPGFGATGPMFTLELFVNGQNIAPVLGAGDDYVESINSFSAAVNGNDQSSYTASVFDFTTGKHFSYSVFSLGNDDAFSSTGIAPLDNFPSFIGRIDILADHNNSELLLNVGSASSPPPSAPVPAPLSLGLFGLGLAGVGLRRGAVIKG
jgi:hypothetical protein